MGDQLLTIVLACQLASTLFMTGIIWFVQIVHYPLFALVPAESFPNYSRRHQQWTTLVVGPAMLLEAMTAVALVRWPDERIEPRLAWTGVALVLTIWLITAVVSVPAHGILEKRFQSTTHRTLVNSNWIRTLCWSARGLLVLLLVFRLIPPTTAK